MLRAVLLIVLFCSLAGCGSHRGFVKVAPGDFQMGSPATELGRFENETSHRVLITRGYEIATTPVTVAQFEEFVRATGYQTAAEKEGWAYGGWNAKANQWDKLKGASWRNPGFAQGKDHPVVDVNWYDAVAYYRWLGEEQGRPVRLPTEAEWEYACRAGTTKAYPWGDDPSSVHGHANCCDATAKDLFDLFPSFDWSNGYRYTSPVGSFGPNAWGLYDMIGNTLEWCSDTYADYPVGEVTVDPTGPPDARQKNLRGGAFVYGPKHCRSAFRGRNDPEFRNFYIGFRVVRQINDSPATRASTPARGS